MKMIILLNVVTRDYQIFAHNLTNEDAENDAAKLRKDGHPAFVIEQHCMHPIRNCEECAKNMHDIFDKLPPKAHDASLN